MWLEMEERNELGKPFLQQAGMRARLWNSSFWGKEWNTKQTQQQWVWSQKEYLENTHPKKKNKQILEKQADSNIDMRSRAGMANSFKYIKVVIYLWKMRLKQERHTVWLHFKRQVCIIPALIRFPEVQSFPGSPKFKTKQSKTNPNICQQSDQCTQGVLKISAGMQAMSWAPNGSKSIQNQQTLPVETSI